MAQKEDALPLEDRYDRRRMARRLREARAGRYVEDVARACGISVSAIAMYETGRRIPREHIKKRLADYYGKTVQEIFYGK